MTITPALRAYAALQSSRLEHRKIDTAEAADEFSTIPLARLRMKPQTPKEPML